METDINKKQINEEIKIFLEECDEILSDFDVLLIEYERTKNSELITKLKRCAHSIKGSAGLVGLAVIQKTAHETEDLIVSLSDISEKKFKTTINQIFDLTNKIKSLIKEAKEGSSHSTDEIIEEIIRYVGELKNDKRAAEKLTSLINELRQHDLSFDCDDILNVILKIIKAIGSAGKLRDTSILNILSGSLKTIKKIITDNENTNQLILINQKLVLTYQMIDGYIEKAAPAKESGEVVNSRPQRKKPEIKVLDNIEQSAFRTLRVETSKIDVLYKNFLKLEKNVYRLNKDLDNTNGAFKQIAEKVFDFEVILNAILSGSDKSEFSRDLKKMQKGINDIQRILKVSEKYSYDDKREEKTILNEITGIKNSIRNIRILPIGVILHMFPRMVRDIAQSLSKEVEIEITGGQTSVDKSIIEEIKIPIIHILRNAVDHGVESPEERENLGKPRAGKIVISVSRTGERIIISVKDDGRGIDIKKIKAKAIKEKIIDRSHVAKLSKLDYLNMVFRPGFSTEDKITEISGRGMGLDIVNNKVTELNGKIKIITESGLGTEIILDLPIDNSIIFESEEQDKKQIKVKDKTIVVVDDSRTTRMYFSKILEEEGYNCITFEFPEEALKKLKTIDCDLIISDIEMPKMDGYEFVANVQKSRKLKEIPIVIISMLKEDMAKDKFKKSKISAFISKSDFNKDMLVKLLLKLLK